MTNKKNFNFFYILITLYMLSVIFNIIHFDEHVLLAILFFLGIIIIVYNLKKVFFFKLLNIVMQIHIKVFFKLKMFNLLRNKLFFINLFLSKLNNLSILLVYLTFKLYFVLKKKVICFKTNFYFDRFYINYKTSNI